jgi:hypothetical protein
MAKQVKTNSRFKPLASNTKVSNTGSFKPLKTNTNISTSIGNVVKGGGYQAPKKTTTPTVKTTSAPRTRAGVSKGNAPGVANKYANKTPLEKKPVVESKPRTRAGASRDVSNGTAGKYETKSTNTNTSKPRTRAGVSKGNAPGTAGKYANKTSINKVSKFGKVAGKVGKVAGKIGRVAGTLGLAYQVTDAIIQAGKGPSQVSAADKKKYAEKKAKEKFSIGFKKPSEIDQIYNAVTGKYDKPKKSTGKSDVKKDTTNTSKPQVGGNRSAKTLIETPSLKDELKKRGVDFKPAKDQAKTNWLDTAKKGDTLKYVINKPKAETKKEDSKKGALPKAIDKAVRAIDGNQPGSGESLKFKGDKSKVAGKDKWGRSPSDKWYGFNPEKKKYEAPTVKKEDNKKSDTKVEVKKPVVTPKVTTPKVTTPKVATPAVKKAEPVGTLAPKSTTEIANKSLEEAKKIIPTKTTTPTATTTTSESSTTTTSPKVTGMQPRATFINKVRGVVNESRERRAGRAASKGNEEKSERLKEKISATEKKMMMKKGGVVKSKTKKK